MNDGGKMLAPLAVNFRINNRVKEKPQMRAYFVAALFLLLSLAFASAQQQTGGTYKLQPDDLIRIQVYRTSTAGSPEPILADVPIGKDGNVSAPFAGIVHAEGLTTTELEAVLAKEYMLRLRLRNPIVSVTVLKFRTVRASVGGFVNRPGTYEMRPGDSLVSLLNMGGGFVPDRADLRRATLRHANSNELIPIDLYAMLILGDTTQNYEIQDGDELNVPEERLNRVMVMGAVQAPGVYPYKEPMTLADAVSLARGPIPYTSKLSQALVIRQKIGEPGQYVRILANYVRYIKNGDATQNVTLEPGDMVYVPETNTPDFARISQLANVAFIIDRFGGTLFGLRLFSQ